MLHTPEPWYAVQYANYWSLQKAPCYDDADNLIDEDCCPLAENNAKLAAAAPVFKTALERIVANSAEFPFINRLASDALAELQTDYKNISQQGAQC